jgi:hypothetical protein
MQFFHAICELKGRLGSVLQAICELEGARRCVCVSVLQAISELKGARICRANTSVL